MSIRKLTVISQLLAMAVVINLVESLIPGPIPGAKIGLANVVTIIVLSLYGYKEGMLVTIFRVFIVAMFAPGRGIFDDPFKISLLGGLFATTAMFLMIKVKFFGTVGTSLVGAIFHCIGQILAIIFLTSIGINAIAGTYLIVMIALSIFSGVFVGIIAGRLIPRLKDQLT